MSYLKSFAVLVVSSLGALALLGASSASAEFNTQLCLSPKKSVCDEPATKVHIVLQPKTIGRLLTPLIDILCLDVLVNATLLELGEPHQQGHVEQTFRQCGSNSPHNNCDIFTEEQPLGYLLKTGEGTGVLVGESGILRVKCTISSFIEIDCRYSAAELEISIEDPGIGVAEGYPIPYIEGGSLCPEEALADGVMVSLDSVYIRS
jgi:hypothetical protein